MKNQDLREFLKRAIEANSSEAEYRDLSQSELSMVVADFVEEAICYGFRSRKDRIDGADMEAIASRPLTRTMVGPFTVCSGPAEVEAITIHLDDRYITKTASSATISIKHMKHGPWKFLKDSLYECVCGHTIDPVRELEWPPKPECPESPDGHHDSCPWSPDSNNVVVVFCAQCRLDLFQFLLPSDEAAKSPYILCDRSPDGQHDLTGFSIGAHAGVYCRLCNICVFRFVFNENPTAQPLPALAGLPGDGKCHCVACERFRAEHPQN